MGPFRRLRSLLEEHSGPGYKSTLTQLREVTELLLRGHLHPSEYFAYGLGREDVRRREMARYLGNYAHWHEVLPQLNQRAWTKLVGNKWFFQIHFQDVAPLPEAYGLYHVVHGTTLGGEPLASAEDLERLIERRAPHGFVAKPALGWKGEGVYVIKEIVQREEGVTCVAQDGSTRTFQELAAEFDRGSTAGDPAAEGFILQQRLTQDPEMDEIAPHGTHTIRIVTIADSDGDVHIPFSVIKMGDRSGMVDNWAAGATKALIEVETGVVQPGFSKKTGHKKLTRHPGTDVLFAGKVVPHWEEILATARRMIRSAPGLSAVGWDMILSNGQPYVIEGNDDWDLVTNQWMRFPFLQEETVSVLRSHGIDVEPDALPPVRLGRALRILGLRSS